MAKKPIIFILAFVMMLGMTACGGSPSIDEGLHIAADDAQQRLDRMENEGTKSKALNAYGDYLSSNYDENVFFSVIDLDKDGIPEMMCKEESRFFCENIIFAYKNGQVTKVLWNDAPSQNDGAYWMENTGTFAFFCGGWEDTDLYLSVYKEFAYDGQKVKMVNDVWGRYKGLNGGDYVNGALNDGAISESEYVLVKERIESGKTVNYYRNTKEDRNCYLK